MPQNIQTVSSVNRYLKGLFEGDWLLRSLYVRGEVSGCKYHPSGHIYFTLKDEGGVLRAVMFAGNRRRLGFALENGQHVIAGGSIGIYERDGSYQLYVRDVRKEGTGELYLQFEQLKEKLSDMGMFDASFKKPVPRYAKRVGVITASSGAALRDICQIAARRNPYVQLVLYPALVQGEEAPASLVKALAVMDGLGLDVIIIGRGGGSWEDLGAFNTEEVARAIFECDTPVISAVGHETDTTIADYVADMRAPTPSAAAELAVFDYQAFTERIREVRLRLRRQLEAVLSERSSRLGRLRIRLERLHPRMELLRKRQLLADAQDSFRRLVRGEIDLRRQRVELMKVKLKGLDPSGRLEAGMAYISDGSGNRIDTVRAVSAGNIIRLRLKDGTIAARVLEVSEEKDLGRKERHEL